MSQILPPPAPYERHIAHLERVCIEKTKENEKLIEHLRKARQQRDRAQEQLALLTQMLVMAR